MMGQNLTHRNYSELFMTPNTGTHHHELQQMWNSSSKSCSKWVHVTVNTRTRLCLMMFYQCYQQSLMATGTWRAATDENYRGRGNGHIHTCTDRDTNIFLGKGRGVIDPIPNHRHDLAFLL